MKVNVPHIVRTDVELKPGDTCVILRGYKIGRTMIVRRIIEARSGLRVVFTDGTWRHLSNYGFTWQKVMH